MKVRPPQEAVFPDVLQLLRAADIARLGESDWGPVVLRDATLTVDTCVPALYARRGYEPVRHSGRGGGAGSARPLLRASFRELHARGERRVALGVDVQNPTGATRLYERVGMRVFWEAAVYEQVLRA